MIYDAMGVELYNAQLSIRSETEKIFIIQVDCLAGYYLYAERDSEFAVDIYGRKQGSLDWNLLTTDPIDLSADDGLKINYEIRLVAEVIGAFSREAFKLKVTLL